MDKIWSETSLKRLDSLCAQHIFGFKLLGEALCAINHDDGSLYVSYDQSWGQTHMVYQSPHWNGDEALLQAQLKDNETVIAKAKADAEAAKIKAQGERDAISLMGDNYVLLRNLEVQRITSEKWNGQLPMTVFGNSQVPNLLFNVDKK